MYLRRTALAVAALLAATALQAQTLPPPERMPPMPPIIILPPSPPLIRAPHADQPIQLVAATVKAQVAGTLATTRIELSFLNPNPRQLEGELQFPLLDGQNVTGFALESLDGGMMPAAPVNKNRGREVFEAIERRGADPALLEQTQGNNFKLRIYPLLPNKPRRVSIEISELLLPGADGRVTWRLPLQLGGSTHLKLAVNLHGMSADKLTLAPELKGAEVLDRHGDAWVTLDKARFQAQAVPSLSWTLGGSSSVFSDRFEGVDYFHAEIPLNAAPQPRPTPAAVALVWDASGSGATRDHDREFALLDAYFKTFKQLKVTLILAREVAEPPREYTVINGDWHELLTALRGEAYDGASNPAAWSLPAGFKDGVALLFGDGLGNWGAGAMQPAAVPLYTVNAGVSGNANLLRLLAERSPGGQFLDLQQLDTAAALAELGQVRPRLRLDYSSGTADLVAPSVYPQQGRLRVAGRLTSPEAALKFSLIYGDDKVEVRQLRIKADPDTGELVSDVAAKRWAGYRINQLEAEPARHRAEIERIGIRFGVVSSQTSLLVLESLADYLQYHITPPAGPMRDEYLKKQRAEEKNTLAQRSNHLDDLARRFSEVVKWWQTDFPKDAPPKFEPKALPMPGAMPGVEMRFMAMDARRAEASQQVRSAPPPLALMAMPSVGAPTALVGAAPPAHEAGSVANPMASIQMQAWQPDSPFAKRLREASPANRYAIYLDERPGHANSTAFFLDAADVFFEKGQPELALRVLSNLAEMDLESRAILRILAYRLSQAGQVKLALPLLQRVRDLAPEEPQSWRDLGLALAADGQQQAALDALWETAARPWDGRFSDIDLTALAELNALIAKVPNLDASKVDARLKRNLPLDLRAVLAWDADNTDIDLWVIDPNGEKAFYSHPLSYQGGKLSRDFTAGYGPETYSLRTAKPGRYEVRAQFYGHRQQALSPYTTLMLRLSTGFGTPAQKDADVTLRLTGAREEVLVGSFEVGGKP